MTKVMNLSCYSLTKNYVTENEFSSNTILSSSPVFCVFLMDRDNDTKIKNNINDFTVEKLYFFMF